MFLRCQTTGLALTAMKLFYYKDLNFDFVIGLLHVVVVVVGDIAVVADD